MLIFIAQENPYVSLLRLYLAIMRKQETGVYAQFFSMIFNHDLCGGFPVRHYQN
jgi:hypothetical protein